MKTIYKYLIIALICALPVSCIVDTELQEIPRDFASPENSFVDKAGFESALAGVYLAIRTELYGATPNYEILGLDADFTGMRAAYDTYNEFWYWNTLNKDNGTVKNYWQKFYGWIFRANVIIDRAENPAVKWASEEEKNQIVGEARFLRAFGYHFLASLFGGVPLVLNESSAPKFDYTRASEREVYEQCKTDLDFAVQWMKTVDQQPGGRAPRAAAYHLLSEIEISLGNYQDAVNAASAVINNPNFHLMTERFGVRTDFTFNGYDYQGPQEPWGDVFWDLYQEGNMNWSDGNSEAIWNIETDPRLTGGASGNFRLEGTWSTEWWRFYVGKDGVSNMLKDTLSGRPVGPHQCSDYSVYTIWEFKNDGNNDIRNSKYNIRREYYWVNPNSQYYGQLISPDHLIDPSTFISRTVPMFMKGTTAVHYGLRPQVDGQNQDDGTIFKDWYIMRMAETYLLRAEAYMRAGDSQKAADDINVIRRRAKCQAMVEASEVNIDLIFDERARELYMEEFRLNTLMRTGKLVEYLMKYNGSVIERGYQLPDYKNKFPIPQSEIEANKGTVLEQNPGY
jgi:hypothetical protein